MDDYIIAIDDSGQPYIEHAFGMGSMIKRKNAKYIARIKTAKGHYRYFYTQKEWDAYKRNQEKAKERKQAKLDKAKEKAENGTNVSVKQYLTGGREQDVYREVKKNTSREKREMNAAKKKAEKAASAYVKSSAKYRKQYNKEKERDVADTLASMTYPYLNWNPTGSAADYAPGKRKKMEKATADMHTASAEYEKAKKRYEASEKRLQEHEKRYESTSLPGQIHKYKRKAKTVLKRHRSKTLSDISNAPLIYVRKST